MPERILAETYDAIYITHLHPDHFDRNFLSKYLRRHPGTPIVIAKYAHPWLKSAVKRLAGGSQNVVELESFDSTTIGDIDLRVVVADVCNPRICGASIPCIPQGWRRGIDSVGVFSADGKVFCNANDALAVSHIPKLAKAIGAVDLLMGHYGGASPFPQCFSDVKDKSRAGREVVETTCAMLAAAADSLHARYLMPFAGQYVLGGRLVGLNADRASVPLDQAVDILRGKTNAEVFAIAPGSSFDLNMGDWSDDYVSHRGNTRRLPEHDRRCEVPLRDGRCWLMGFLGVRSRSGRGRCRRSYALDCDSSQLFVCHRRRRASRNSEFGWR